ncbi:MAG: DMT family transporter [OCS116 cluster bacterium]|uniref:EamA family transporter n=1 Tax=OCS116 cluster bacterium TaxID=2030921 RepID=A0A2A4Z1T4_9PROT|nr:DMT family transporter [OCS116 cluster bacterium]
MTVFLYLAMILVWGSSWLAIAWQISDISPIVSVFYRFALAAIIMFPMMKILGKIQQVRAKDHIFFALHGALLFSLNFICFYYASHYIVSGLIAIIFSLATIWNALNGYLFYKEKPVPAMKWGILFGLLGLILIFWQDIANVELGGDILLGVGLSVLGVYFFSLGNMITVRNKKNGITSITSTSYGVIYGSVILFIICLILGLEFSFEFSEQYLGALVFLSLIATIFGFTAYLNLVERLGASRAAYILVITPLVALALSTIFEDYQWSITAIIGVLFIALGNFIVNFKKP